MFPEQLETESLALRQFAGTNVDAFELYELFADRKDGTDAVFEYVPQEPYKTVKEAAEQLEDAEAGWSDGERSTAFSPPRKRSRATKLFLEWDRRTGRVGFTFGREHWGNGYAGECALALTELAFDRLDLDVVAIGHEEGNEKSERGSVHRPGRRAVRGAVAKLDPAGRRRRRPPPVHCHPRGVRTVGSVTIRVESSAGVVVNQPLR